MSIRSYTKRIFADALQDMAGQMPIEKIRVKDLCIKCGADRQTFYYHFHDKYDLIAWIFTQDYYDAIASSGDGYPIEHASAALQNIYGKRSFYRKAFSDKSQNAVSEYIYDFFVKLGSDAIEARFGPEALTNYNLYQIKSHSFACIGHTKEWLNGKTDYSADEFARLQYETMPEILRKAYGISL